MQANSEASWAVIGQLTHAETTQVTPVAQEGKARAKTGLNTQTNRSSYHQAG
jgi:hypothetical protein